MAQGFSQIPGLDYNATFANTVSFNTIRVALTIAAEEDYSMRTLDIKTAYLNALLEEEADLWMKQPQGYE